jgi:RNA polymerase sigma-54 factor
MYTKLSLRPQMKTSAQLVINSRLLQVPAAELEAFINQEVINNPALELAKQDDFDPGNQKRAVTDHQPVMDFKSSRAAGFHAPLSFEEMVENIPHQQSPVEQLVRQAALILDKSDLGIAVQLLYRLDARGFLSLPRQQLANDLSVTEETIQRVVALLQQLEPPGIAARDIQECFLIQCDHLEGRGSSCQQLRRILTLAWPEFVNLQWDRVARRTGLSKQEVEHARDFMRWNLTPDPLAMMENASEHHDVLGYPDLIVHQEQDPLSLQYWLEIPGETDFELKISGSFQKIMRDPLPDTNTLSLDEKSWLKTHRDRAWMVINALHQRWTTLRRIGEYLIEHQQDFLASGPSKLKPMTRSRVAQELGLHESTIGRAVRDKIIQVPDGHLLPLEDLFDPSLPGREAVRRLLSDPSNHLRDRSIVEILQANGWNLSRRTIAKYRHELGVEAGRSQTIVM